MYAVDDDEEYNNLTISNDYLIIIMIVIVKPVFVAGLYHDVMLGPKWKSTADILLDFIK